MTRIVALGAVAAVCFAACGDSTDDGDGNDGDGNDGDDGDGNDGGVITDCATDADCTIINSCCAGCLAAHVDSELEPCDSTCIQAPCDAEHGPDAELDVVCNAGTCELEVTEPLDDSCTAAADCKVVNDCCLGCLALSASETVPPCDSQCFQDPCTAEHGPDAMISATCDGGSCGLAIAVP